MNTVGSYVAMAKIAHKFDIICTFLSFLLLCFYHGRCKLAISSKYVSVLLTTKAICIFTTLYTVLNVTCIMQCSTHHIFNDFFEKIKVNIQIK
jgi:magnesium-transporting ATPase (P-type)